MKSPQNERELARVTRRSFLTGALVAGLGFGAWRWIASREDEDELPWPARRVLEMNGALWGFLFRGSRRSGRVAPPPLGKEARFNGDLGLAPGFDPSHWKLAVVEDSRRLELSLDQLKLLPKVENTTEFHCIEGWSDVNTYAGTRFSEFMKAYGFGKKADGSLYRYVGLETPDRGYYVSIDMESMLHPETLLCYELNGRPLSLKNGAPLRLVIPVKYGIKSLKRIGTIRFADERPPDYWAEQGYDWFAGL